jgi:cellulase/cellobiase CelA1
MQSAHASIPGLVGGVAIAIVLGSGCNSGPEESATFFAEDTGSPETGGDMSDTGSTSGPSTDPITSDPITTETPTTADPTDASTTTGESSGGGSSSDDTTSALDDSSSSTTAPPDDTGSTTGPTGDGIVEVEVNVQSMWQDGECDDVVVTNVSDMVVEWQIELPLPGTITMLWNAELTEMDGIGTFVGVDFNAVLDPGEAAMFGFCVMYV